MITDLQLKRFRTFEEFKLSQLGRVNLLVGTNNSGKTSILEAIDILTSRTNPTALYNSMNRRGERLWYTSEGPPAPDRYEVDICRIFHGHASGPSLGAEIRGYTGAEKFSEVSIGVRRSEERRVGKECTSWCRSRWSPYH